MFLHTACFQCHHCSRKLGLGSFSRTKEGDFYCKDPHCIMVWYVIYLHYVIL